MARDLKTIKDPVTGKRTLSFLNGDIETVDGAEECAQRIETALNMVLGEWTFDLLKGLPIFDQIFSRIQYTTLVRDYYRNGILDVFQVKSVEKLDLERGDERDYKMKFEALYEDNSIITGEI